MLTTFDYTLVRGDDELLIEVTYDGTIYRGMGGEPDDFDVEIIDLRYEGEPFEETPEECDQIRKACLDRIEDDFDDHAMDEADYRYEMSREFDYD